MLLESRSVAWVEVRNCQSQCRRAKGIYCAQILLFALAISIPDGAYAQQKAADAKPDKPPSYEVAAIKANKGGSSNKDVWGSTDRLTIGNYTLKELIRYAYDLKSDSQISGGPDWMDKQAFDISAKIDDAEIARMRQMKPDERRTERDLMLQSLLADRFQLRSREVQRVMPVYALTLTKSGPKLTQSSTPGKGYHVSTRNGHMVATNTSMDVFADQLTGMSESGERVVINRTGLAGEYDFKMDFAAEYGGRIPSDTDLPGLFTALQEQLGLRLKPEKGAVKVIIVESAAKPALD